MSKHTHENTFPALVCAALLAVAGCDGEIESTTPRAASIDPTPHAETVAPPPSASAEELPLPEYLATLQPQKTRAGWLRFTDPAIHQPGATALLIERLQTGQDRPEVRAALAEAIGRSQGDYAQAVGEQLAVESDARVREMLVGTLGRRSPDAKAHAGLLLGLHDPEPAVRAATLRSISTRTDGVEFADELIAALADGEVEVRRDAARALGVLRVEAAVAPLGALLSAAEPELRLHGLRAIDRIDPAAALAAGAALTTDDDPRVRKLALSIQSR